MTNIPTEIIIGIPNRVGVIPFDDAIALAKH